MIVWVHVAVANVGTARSERTAFERVRLVIYGRTQYQCVGDQGLQICRVLSLDESMRVVNGCAR